MTLSIQSISVCCGRGMRCPEYCPVISVYSVKHKSKVKHNYKTCYYDI